jgi:hypothetical protein
MAVAQTVLLFGSESWVVTHNMLKTMEAFHHHIAHYIMGRVPVYLCHEEQWSYPPIREAMKEVEMLSISEYIARRRNNIMDFVNPPTHIYLMLPITHFGVADGMPYVVGPIVVKLDCSIG